jgi:hypothetical protein
MENSLTKRETQPCWIWLVDNTDQRLIKNKVQRCIRAIDKKDVDVEDLAGYIYLCLKLVVQR